VIGLVDIQEDYEAGYLDMKETLELFAELICTGQACNLPGHYIRTAHHLIDVGYITPRGQITDAGYKAANEEAVGKYHDEGREGSPCDVSVCNDPLGDALEWGFALVRSHPRGARVNSRCASCRRRGGK
jgi:hypothetical protein